MIITNKKVSDKEVHYKNKLIIAGTGRSVPLLKLPVQWYGTYRHKNHITFLFIGKSTIEELTRLIFTTISKKMPESFL